jgi:RecB family exonuclease
MEKIMFAVEALKYRPWSVSKVNALDACARQFAFKYVQYLKASNKQNKTRLGVLSHNLIERKLKDPNTPAKTHLKVITDSEPLLDEEKEALEKWQNDIESFAARLENFKKTYGVTHTLIESKLAIDTSFAKTNFDDNQALLRGVIDLGMITQDNFLVIIDHKSGKKKPIKEHAIQFYAYMLLGFAAFEGLRGIQCGINYIGSERVDWFPKPNGDSGAWSVQDILGLRSWLVHYLNNNASRLREIDTGVLTPSLGWHCEWCEYMDYCPEGKEEVTLRIANREAKKTKDPKPPTL